MLKNTATKLYVFCWDSATGLPKSGDAANLTAYAKVDAGALTALGDTSATEIDATNAKGWYQFDLAAGETNGDLNLYSCKSSTSGVVCMASPPVVNTLPATGVLAPATAGRTLVVDAAGLADANAVKVGPTGAGTAQTARDIGASVLLSSGTGTGQLDFTAGVVKGNVVQLLGTAWLTPGTAGTPDVNAKLWNGLTTVALPLVPTVAGRTLDVSAGGEAGLDWANVGGPTATVGLTGTTISASQAIASVSGSVGSVTAAVTLSAADSPAFYTGTATAGGATTLTDSGQAWTVNGLAGCRVKLTSGTGARQSRVVVSNTATVLTVDRAWATNPDNTSVYAVVEGDGPKTDAALAVTAGAVGDKTGYSLTQAFPANFAALGVTAGGKVSGVVLADTLTTYTGDTPQSGDAYARIGAAGAGLTALGDARLGHLDADVSSRPTAAAVATAVWQDTTAGDFTVSTSPGKVIFAQLAGAFTTASSSIFSTAALANAPTGGSAPTAAQIATAVWQDTTAGDFTVSTSPGKILFTQLGGAFTTASSSVFTAPALANAPSGTGASAASIATAVWQDLLAGADFGTAGSIGALLKLDIDAAVSSRSTYGGGDTAGTTTLLGRLTSGRATGLDNLDAAVSTRSVYAGGDTAGTTTLLGRLTSGRATGLDNLDAAVSSRSTYAGGDTAGTTTLLTRLPSALTIIAGKVDVNDRTGFSLLASGLDLVLVAGKTLPAALRYIGASAAGRAGGAGSGTETFRDFAGVVALTVLVDDQGNRSGVTYG